MAAQPETRAALAAAAVGDLDAVVDDLAPRELTAVAIGLASARLAHTTPFAALFAPGTGLLPYQNCFATVSAFFDRCRLTRRPHWAQPLFRDSHL